MGKPFDEGVLASFIQRAMPWVLAFVGYLVYRRMRPALSAAVVADTAEPVAAPEGVTYPVPVSPR
jgi:hypothetical protein